MSTEIPPIGRDAGSAARLQILATEHWSLLATRALTYNEALSRVTIFLSILSGALIALALVAQAEQAAERRGEDRDGGVAIERKARELRDQRDGLGGDQQYHAYDREPSQSWLTS